MSNPSIPALQTAIISKAPGELAISNSVPVPLLEKDAVLVKVHAVAINPVDAKAADNLSYPGAISGFDFSGTVVVVDHSSSSSSSICIGDKVCGAVHGMHILHPTEGAFAQYVVASLGLLMKIPESMSMDDAATLSTGLGTAALGIRSLGLETTATKPGFVLVSGGSTATGTLAIQLCRLRGYRVIATCSPKNSDLVKSYGAEEVFDYGSPNCASDIRAYTKKALGYVLDCASDAVSMELCYAAIGRAGGRYTSLEPYSHRVAKLRQTVKPDWVFQPALFGKKVGWAKPYERDADPDMRDFAKKMYGSMQELLEEDKLRPHPASVHDEGFQGIIDGVDLVRRKTVSAQKLVYRIPGA